MEDEGTNYLLKALQSMNHDVVKVIEGHTKRLDDGWLQSMVNICQY